MTVHSLFRSPLTRPFVWFFASLSLLATLSPPGATHDEMFHATNIWCGQGERAPYCSGIRFDVPSPGALVNFDLLTCQRDIQEPLECPSDGVGTSFRTVNHGNLYPTLPNSQHSTPFYFVLSWFVVPSAEASFLLIRVVSVLLISILFAALVYLLPERHRNTVFLTIIFAMPSTGYFLFASINPSSWAVFGVGFSWIAFHAAVGYRDLASRRRLWLFCFGAIMSVMAVGSRWDAPGFLAYILCLIGVMGAWKTFPERRSAIIGSGVASAVLMWVLLERFTPLSPMRFVGVLTSYTEGQPTNLEFFSSYLLLGVPNALEALGTVPTTSVVRIPDIVFLVNLTSLGAFLFLTRKRRSFVQIGGAIATLLLTTVVIMAQVDLIDNRDNEGIEPRYSLPLLAFVVGWWFLNSPDLGNFRWQFRLRSIAWIATAMFGLTALTFAERFTDHQSFRLRLLPEGPDQWWWSFLSIGPNAALVMSVVCFAVFVHRSVDVLMAGQADVFVQNARETEPYQRHQ